MDTEVLLYLVIFLALLAFISGASRPRHPRDGYWDGYNNIPPQQIIIAQPPYPRPEPDPIQAIITTAIFMALVWFLISFGCNVKPQDDFAPNYNREQPNPDYNDRMGIVPQKRGVKK